MHCTWYHILALQFGVTYGFEVYLIFQVFYTLYTKEDWNGGVTAWVAKDDAATPLRFSYEEKQPCKDPFNFQACFFSTFREMKILPWRQFAGSSSLPRPLLMGTGEQASQSTDTGCQLSVWGRDPRAFGTFQLPVWVIERVTEVYSRKMSHIQVQTASWY